MQQAFPTSTKRQRLALRNVPPAVFPALSREPAHSLAQLGIMAAKFAVLSPWNLRDMPNRP
jgi:hypothetical protein